MVAVPAKLAVIDSVQYAVATWETRTLGRLITHSWDEGFAGGMGEYKYFGGPKDRYYRSQGLVGQVDGFHLTPEITWQSSALTNGIAPALKEYVFVEKDSGSNEFIYVLIGRYAWKLSSSNGVESNVKDFGGGAEVGKPEKFNGKWYVPLGPNVDYVELTTVVSSGADTWTTVAERAVSFAQTVVEKTPKVAKSLADKIYFTPTPQTAGTYDAGFTVGDPDEDIIEIHTYKGEFIAVKPQNLYRFDIHGQSWAVQEFVGSTRNPFGTASARLGAHSQTFGQYFYWCAGSVGIWRILSALADHIGYERYPEWQDANFQGILNARGRWNSFAAYGRYAYATLEGELYYGEIDEDGRIRWHGSLSAVSGTADWPAAEVVKIITSTIGSVDYSPKLLLLNDAGGSANTVTLVPLAPDGGMKGLLGYGDAVAATYRCAMSDVVLGSPEEEVQLRYAWFKLRKWDTNIDLELGQYRNGDDTPVESVASDITPEAGESVVRFQWTPGSNEMCHSVRLRIGMVVSAGYGGGGDPVIEAFGLVAATPSFYTVTIPVTRSGMLAGREPKKVMQDLRNLLDKGPVPCKEPAFGGPEDTWDGWVKGYDERPMTADEIRDFKVTGEGWIVELLIQRFDWGS